MYSPWRRTTSVFLMPWPPRRISASTCCTSLSSTAGERRLTHPRPPRRRQQSSRPATYLWEIGEGSGRTPLRLRHNNPQLRPQSSSNSLRPIGDVETEGDIGADVIRTPITAVTIQGVGLVCLMFNGFYNHCSLMFLTSLFPPTLNL